MLRQTWKLGALVLNSKEVGVEPPAGIGDCPPKVQLAAGLPGAQAVVPLFVDQVTL